MGVNMGKETLALIAEARRKAESGVDYSPRFGAVCPVCGKAKIPIVTSRPWRDNLKTRYHKCDSEKCLLKTMNLTVKSIEVA